jgi:glycosyltransferase involved in cell wall biosynthesis
MRIQFDNVASMRTGPGTFANRLAVELWNMGHELVDDPNADVSLVFIERTGKPLAKKVVQRLDGIWFKTDEFETKNAGIKDLYMKADGVIWQSTFDREMTLKWWGMPKHGDVIHNGIDLTRVDKVTIPELAKIRSTYDTVFVCSSNWHPQKRLRDNIKLFDHLRKTQFPNSCLFVLGNNPDVMSTDPHVLYTGSQPSEVYLQIFAVADWMLHLAWADHCPNVVLESLSQGTPVVCSDVGGTKELVCSFGHIIKDQPYNYELADYDNPPPLDISQVVLPTKDKLGAHSNINIKVVAQSYVTFFEGLLK